MFRKELWLRSSDLSLTHRDISELPRLSKQTSTFTLMIVQSQLTAHTQFTKLASRQVLKFLDFAITRGSRLLVTAECALLR